MTRQNTHIAKDLSHVRVAPRTINDNHNSLSHDRSRLIHVIKAPSPDRKKCDIDLVHIRQADRTSPYTAVSLYVDWEPLYCSGSGAPSVLLYWPLGTCRRGPPKHTFHVIHILLRHPYVTCQKTSFELANYVAVVTPCYTSGMYRCM